MATPGVLQQFWTKLLERAELLTQLHSRVSPADRNWIAASAGKPGLSFHYYALQHAAQAELYIYRGKGKVAENKRIFEALLSDREQIERDFGGSLRWELLKERSACRICERIEIGGYRDHERWPEIQEALIDAMIRLERALRPHIARLPS